MKISSMQNLNEIEIRVYDFENRIHKKEQIVWENPSITNQEMEVVLMSRSILSILSCIV